MLIIGVDPGAAGAIGIANKDQVHSLELLEDIDYGWLEKLVATANPLENVHIYLEKAQAMPGQGVTSMFNYGMGFGKLLGWIEALRKPHTLITPRDWTKAMHQGCTGKDAKEKSLIAAKRLFPTLNFLASERSKKPHAGLIDAALITEYGRRTLCRGLDVA